MKEANKKVLYIHHSFGMGGAPRSLAFLAKEIESFGWDVSIFLIYDGPVREYFKKLKLKTFAYTFKVISFHGTVVSGMTFKLFISNLIYFIPSLVVAFLALKKHRPHILHLNTSSLFAFAIASKLFFPKVKVVSHIREPLLPNFFGRILGFFNSLFCDKLIAINTFEKNGFNKEKLTVIHNSVDTRVYQPILEKKEALRSIELDVNKKYIGSFCRATASNGVLDFIELAKHCRDKKDWHFIFFGYQEELDLLNLKSKVKDVENITLHDMTDDIVTAMQAMSCVVSLFTKPHFSRQLIEAQSCGVPVIATNVDSQNTLLMHEETGYIAEIADYRAQKTYLTKILEQDDYVALSQNARTFAKEKYCNENNAKRIQEIYDNLLAE